MQTQVHCMLQPAKNTMEHELRSMDATFISLTE